MIPLENTGELLINATTFAFPGAVAEVGNHNKVLWQQAFGVLNKEPPTSSANLDTVYDLASLTKVIATTTLAMHAVDKKLLSVNDLVSRWSSLWNGNDRRDVNIADLLLHESGLPAYLPIFRDHLGRDDFEQEICSLALTYHPRSAAIYSDLGFILLGFILEDAFGSSLNEQFDSLAQSNKWGGLTFMPTPELRQRTAPTEFDPWRGRQLVGEVHDENAWALGGVAGHAGLFGTASDVGRFAQTILQQFKHRAIIASSETFSRFTTLSRKQTGSRAYGWDTMLKTSSCGRQMSARAIGHTGFTGTSLWIDPDSDLYFVLLTNRVHPSRTNDSIVTVRPRFHNAVISELRDKS